jgi:hypothetical protein
VPTSSAVGVARPSAHGHATISTATAALNATVSPAPAPAQNPPATTASTSTPGTNVPDTRSASRCTAALPVCARSTIAAIWASWVSAPIRVALTTSRPVTLTQPPTTSAPFATSTGTVSPVIMLVSTDEPPSVTTPSVAIFSPARTTNRSPTTSWSIGIVTSLPARRTVASRAASATSARSAAPDRRRALTSAYRPASTNVMTPAATSR